MCDSCDRTTETRKVRLSVAEGPLRHLDLCDKCRRPLEKLLGKAAERRPIRSGISGLPVVSDLSEVEKRKQRDEAARKRALRRTETGPGATQPPPVGGSEGGLFKEPGNGSGGEDV